MDNGRDGISYLLDAKRNGIVTPLSAPYELEILRRTETTRLGDALMKIRVRGQCVPYMRFSAHDEAIRCSCRRAFWEQAPGLGPTSGAGEYCAPVVAFPDV